jgi:hypothetical protein
MKEVFLHEYYAAIIRRLFLSNSILSFFSLFWALFHGREFGDLMTG